MAKDKVVFTGVKLKSFTRNKKGGTADLSSNINSDVRKLMKWAEMPDGYPSAKPGGVIVATKMLLRSDKADLATYEVSVDISSITGFEIVRLETEGKRGKGTRLELHFKVSFVDIEGCAVLENYITSAVDSVGTLEVTYQAASGKVDVTNPAKLDADRQIELVVPEFDEDDAGDESGDEEKA